MPLVNAKCTNCGANLLIDNTKDAAICPYCNSAYIVEKAIVNYMGNHFGTIHANTVNIYGGATVGTVESSPVSKYRISSPEVLKRFEMAKRFSGTIYPIYQGSRTFIYLKSDGTLGISGLKKGFFLGCIDLSVLKWENIKQFCYIPPHSESGRDSIGAFLVAITFDGRLLVSDCFHMDYDGNIIKDNEYAPITRWDNVDRFILSQDNTIIAIQKNGSVLSHPNIPELSTWRNIKTVFTTVVRGRIVYFGIMHDGRTRFSAGLKDYEIKKIQQWSDIKEICFPYFLLNSGNVLVADFDSSPDHYIAQNILSIHGNIGLHVDGSLENFVKGYGKITFDECGSGYCQVDNVFDGGIDDYWLLSVEGRVDHKQYRSIQREQYSDVIAIVDGRWFVHSTGTVQTRYDKPFVLFSGSPSDFGVRVSTKIPNTETKESLIDHYMMKIDQFKREKGGTFSQKRSRKRFILKYESDLRFAQSL